MRQSHHVVSELRPGVPDDALPAAQQQAGAEALSALVRLGDSDIAEIVSLVQHICDVPAAGLSLVSEGRVHMAVASGFDTFSCDLDDSLCGRTLDSHFTVVVEDASADSRFSSSPLVDGRAHSLRFYASSPVYTADGSMVGRLCVVDDEPRSLTPLQEQTLTTLADSVSRVLELRMRHGAPALAPFAAAAAEDEVLQTAARISHDLRIPLTSLTTSLEMLHETVPAGEDPSRARVLESARRSAARMTRMVDGLLGLNRVGRSLRSVDLDLGTVARQVVDDVAALLSQFSAIVDLGELPTVRADADQLYSVLLNLVSNAVKFARPGVAPHVRIRARRTGQTWRITVTDNGRGVPAERREDVFGMFARLDTSVEGSGIGLASVKRIVEAHGGRVGIEDAGVVGTKVWFELPAPAQAPAAPATAAVRPTLPGRQRS